MMRSLAETGNGWMTFKDATQPEVQPDGQAGQRRASFEPLHGDH
jgi:hypothetical protein